MAVPNGRQGRRGRAGNDAADGTTNASRASADPPEPDSFGPEIGTSLAPGPDSSGPGPGVRRPRHSSSDPSGTERTGKSVLATSGRVVSPVSSRMRRLRSRGAMTTTDASASRAVSRIDSATLEP